MLLYILFMINTHFYTVLSKKNEHHMKYFALVYSHANIEVIRTDWTSNFHEESQQISVTNNT